jgi:hypothetical protein
MAQAISRFVGQTYSGLWQSYGHAPGQLALGYQDLSNDQVTQAKAAAQHVAAQDGALPGNQTAVVPATSGGGGGGTDNSGQGDNTTTSASNPGQPDNNHALAANAAQPGSTAGPAGAAGGSTSKPGTGTGASPSAAPVAAGQPAADRAGLTRLALPLVLSVGGVLLVGGPLLLGLAGTARGAKVSAWWCRTWRWLIGSEG